MVDPYTHYKRNEDTYNQIADSLGTIRDIFLNADRFTQKVMLFDSSFYAVVSVQNDISILRDAFRAYQNADDWDEVRDALRSVNYGNNKFDYVRSNFDAIFGETGDQIIDELEQYNPIEAVEIGADKLDGVSFIKAPFIFAMLGFTSVMCIDTNVAQMVDDDDIQAKGYTSIGEYCDAMTTVETEFDDLMWEVSTFMLQWVVFDANRGDGVARHEEWFEVMLPGSPFGRQTWLAEY